MKVAFHTLGCKVNQYETEAMKEQFASAGHEVVAEDEAADAYIINTCTVTNLADRKSRQYIRRMKKISPDAVVAVTGCYAQVKPEEILALPEVDIVAGTGEKNNLLGYIDEFISERKKQKHIRSYDELSCYQDHGIITSMENRTRAFVKIQEGCNRFCSYCLIPFARGQVRSRNPEEIIEEVKTLIDKGFKEIVLTGINTALYGTEESFPFELTDEEKTRGVSGIEIIIGRINALDGEFRIRLSSLEPTVVNAEYVKRLLTYEKLCPHLHLSIQSGSDNIIKAMNRHYSRAEYLDIVRVLKEHDPHYGVTTDIICGFPGESEEDFADSLRIIEDAGFLKVHAFRFSRREGTAAWDMKNQVKSEVKNVRVDALIEKAETAARRFLEESAGEVRTVLFEQAETCDDETMTRTFEAACEGVKTCETAQISGYTENYIKVYADGGEENLNDFKKVRLLEPYKDGMKGEILK